jgi:two-component system, NarL family, captular synthesis response regulator RcsB
MTRYAESETRLSCAALPTEQSATFDIRWIGDTFISGFPLMAAKPVKIIIADDHPAVLEGIKYELACTPTFDVVGTARNSTEVMELLDYVLCDVLVTDYMMPGGKYGDGMVFISFLRRRYPELKIVMLTMIDNPALIRAMATLGVQSILNKTDDIKHLTYAIHAVQSGALYFSATNSQQILQTYHGRAKKKDGQQLTSREAEVVRLYVSGLSVNQIAKELSRSKQTISSQKNTAMRKLGIESDADLFRFAYDSGMIEAIKMQGDALPPPPIKD